MVGYKTLTKTGRSLSSEYGEVYYPLPIDDKPGDWITVPGNGSYVAHEDGLFVGGIGDTLVKVECEDEVVVETALVGVRCWRKVRILAVLPWTDLPVGVGEWRCRAARDIKCLTDDERRTLVLGIPEEQGKWRYWAALNIRRLTDEERRTLVFGIPEDQYQWRCEAARLVNGLTDGERRTLVFGIPKEQGKLVYLAARYVECLTDGERRSLVLSIPKEQREWRRSAVLFIGCLTDEDRKTLRGDNK